MMVKRKNVWWCSWCGNEEPIKNESRTQEDKFIDIEEFIRRLNNAHQKLNLSKV